MDRDLNKRSSTGGKISSIVSNAKRASYQETNTDKSVENIDPEILKLLGLEDATDLDYGEYKTLLKEQMMAGRMRGTGMSSEETERLTNEFKRVKANTGKFVINANNLGRVPQTSSRRGSGGGDTTNITALLEGSKERNEEQDEKINSILTVVPNTIQSITKVLENVNNILGVTVAVDEEQLDQQKEQDLQDVRDAEEKARESSKKKLGGFSMPKISMPEIPFMDRIKQFFGNVLMGGLAVGLLEWIQDPKNQESIDNFVDFIVDKSPLILGGILALAALPIAGTILSVLGAVKGAIALLIGVIGKMGGLIIGAIKGALAAAGIGLGVGLALTGGAIAATIASKDPLEQMMEDARRETYGEENLNKGTFITKLRDQYGRTASQSDRDRLLSDEEKLTATLLKNYDNQLQKVEKIKKEIQQLEITKSQAIDPRRQNQLADQIEQRKKDLENSQLTVTQIEEAINIDGKSFDELQSDFEQNLILPQTNLSKELYPKSGTGEDLSVGLPRSQMMTEELFNERLDAQQSIGIDDSTLLGKDNYEDYVKEFVPGSSSPGVSSPTPTTPLITPSGTTSGPNQESVSIDIGENINNLQPDQLESSIERTMMKVTPPRPPGSPSVTVVAAQTPAGGNTSGSQRRKSTLPSVGAVDQNNDTLTITRSVYNIIQ